MPEPTPLPLPIQATVGVTSVVPVEETESATRRLIVRAVAVSLICCVLLLGSLSLALVWKPPQEWQLINTVIGNLNALALLLAGGLLGMNERKAGGGIVR